jgi:hypothetical protein
MGTRSRTFVPNVTSADLTVLESSLPNPNSSYQADRHSPGLLRRPIDIAIDRQRTLSVARSHLPCDSSITHLR